MGFAHDNYSATEGSPFGFIYVINAAFKLSNIIQLQHNFERSLCIAIKQLKRLAFRFSRDSSAIRKRLCQIPKSQLFELDNVY